MHYSKKLDRFLFGEVDLPLESVILIIGGMALAITGCLLFFVSAGTLPYYENGFYGLLLIVFALQTIAMGKTPFGEIRQSKISFYLGIVIASMGIITCFVPGIFDPLPRILLSVCFGLGGVAQLLQAYLDETKMRTWMKYGGVFRQLIFACTSVYVLSILAGFLLWTQPTLPTPIMSTIMILFGFVVIYLGAVLKGVYLAYPEADTASNKQLILSFDHSVLLLTGIFMILLGTLLIPVSFGIIPFSENAQIGLLMIIFAIQMLASGNTPIGPFPHRSWLMIVCGAVFAALGIVSCVIPNLLVAPLTRLVAVLNILGGLIPMVKRLLFSTPTTNQSFAHPLLRKLFRTQLTLSLLSVMFGSSMLFPGIIPGLIIGAILAANGVVLVYLLRILISIAILANGASESR